MIRNLIKIEQSYINCKHPDFLKATHAYQAIQAPNKKGEVPQSQHGFFVQFFGPEARKDESVMGKVKDAASAAGKAVFGEAGSSWTAREKRGVEMIKVLLDVYFSIVRRKVCDHVVKAIMGLLVNPMKEQLHGHLVAQLYKEDKFDSLLEETLEVVERRKLLKEMLKKLEKANALLDDVHEVGKTIEL